MPLVRRTLKKNRKFYSDREVKVVMGHMSLKGSTLSCIKASLHKEEEEWKGGRVEVLGSPDTRLGYFKFHVDECQEGSVQCDWRVLQSPQRFCKLH